MCHYRNLSSIKKDKNTWNGGIPFVSWQGVTEHNGHGGGRNELWGRGLSTEKLSSASGVRFRSISDAENGRLRRCHGDATQTPERERRGRTAEILSSLFYKLSLSFYLFFYFYFFLRAFQIFKNAAQEFSVSLLGC